MYNINHSGGIETGTNVVIFLVTMVVWEENQILESRDQWPLVLDWNFRCFQDGSFVYEWWFRGMDQTGGHCSYLLYNENLWQK